jgi:aspartate/methionine/tyrosine aminotransferase
VDIADFKIERYFAQWEFAVPFVLGASDIEGYRQSELLAMADDECRRLWDGLTLGYTESQGHPLLRAEIASLYDRIDADHVIVSNPSEAIFLFAHAVLRRGDHVIVVWPAYQSLYEAARSAHADVTLVPLTPESGWRLDLDALRAALRPSTRAIVINSPHNPTGTMLDRDTFEGVVALAREAGAWLFSDEMYRFLEFDSTERLSAGADAYERGVSLGGMSKAFAMGGVRIGWLATRDRKLIERVGRMKDYTSICCSAPSEILALIALRARDRVLARSRDIVHANLGRLDRFFDEWREHIACVRSRGGSIAFPWLRSESDLNATDRLNGADRAPIRAGGNGSQIEAFARELVEQEGVLIVPGQIFEFPGNHFRVGLGRRNLPEALDRLDGFMRRRLARSPALT